MCLAALLFPFLNAGVKHLGTRYPMPEIFWARYAGHLLICLVTLLPRYGLRIFVSRHPIVQGWRAVLLFAASAFYFLGLRTIDLSTAAAVSFIGPIIVTALSVPMLGEHVGVRRWTAVIIGFVGALAIIRPGSAIVQWGAILVALDAFCYAVYQILSRKVGGSDPATVSITLSGLGGVFLASLLLPVSDLVAPRNALDALIFLSLGLPGLLGHFFVVKAYQWGSASLVAPLIYLELAGATLLGYVFFAQLPDLWTWLGAAIIVTSGLYIAYREQTLRRRAAAQAVAT
jgi:drug/metabolite transporter (DMT)-like permease